MKQTSIEWLIEKITEQGTNPYWDMRFKQAKEMEKEQIVQAAARGYLVGEDNISLEDAKLYGDEYYYMTFKTK